MTVNDPEVQARFERALKTLVSRLEQDPYVLAVVLLGSMSHDAVWEKSDIDLMIVTQEVKRRNNSLTLTEEGVVIHAYMQTRSELKKMMDGSLQSSFLHSMLSKGTLIFTRDETIGQAFEARFDFGARDRETVRLQFAAGVMAALYKAEKWLYAKGDLPYCAFYILLCAQSLAAIEAAEHGEIVGREVIQQALRLNPKEFTPIYLDLLEQPISRENLERAIQVIGDYLRSRIDTLFAPILRYLEDEGTARSASEICDYFSKHARLESVDGMCDWLADEGVIHKLSTPVRVTEKSRVSVEEAAYYYDGTRPGKEQRQ